MDTPAKSKKGIYKPQATEVKRQYNNWRSWYAQNDYRAQDDIMFGLVGDQWEQKTIASRGIQNKESLVFNLCLKHNKRLKAQSKEIEFSLDLMPVNDSQDMNETAVFRMLLSSLMLSDDVLNTGSEALDKCVDYGYSAVLVSYKREDDRTMNLVPHLIPIKDPSTVFWDKNAQLCTKIDGKYCGIRKFVTRSEIERKVPEYFTEGKATPWIIEEKNEWIDYWYRVYVPAKYIRLPSREYKREDLLTEDDRASLEDDNGNPIKFKDNQPSERMGTVCKIYYRSFCNDRVMGEPKLYPTHDLPIAYHPALTVWTRDQDYTFSFINPLKGAQQLHNFLNSQIATIAKNSGATKWIATPDMASEDIWAQNLKNINTMEGAIVIGKDRDGKELRREEPTELPVSLIQMAQGCKQLIDEISGAMIDTQNAQQTVISGTALEKVTHNMELLHAPIMASHIVFMNTLGKLVRQMIPFLYTEERTIIVKKNNGVAQPIRINKSLPTGTMQNNIRDIDNKFHYQIIAGPSSEMEKQDLRDTLATLYGLPEIGPEIVRRTVDIFAKIQKSNQAPVIARRLAGLVNPVLQQYADGELSEDEFKEETAKQEQQAKQEMMNNPQNQSMMMISQAELGKAQAAQKTAEARVMQAQAETQIKAMEVQIEQQRLIKEATEAERQLQLKFMELMQKEDAQTKDRELQMLDRLLDRQHELVKGLMDNAKSKTASSNSDQQGYAA